VQWVLLKEPITLSKSQIAAFTRLFPDNHRPVQSFKDRQLE
jgi:carbonic anhydrase